MIAQAEADPNWRRVLWLMVIVRTAMSLSFSFSGPFLPLFLIELNVRPLSHVEIWAGLIASINFLLSALISPVWGALSDRYGRKAMVVRSSISACIFNGLMGLAQNEWQLFIFAAMSGVFGGFSAASMTLVSTMVPEESLGFTLGWMATAQFVGTLIGPLVGGILADHLHDYRAVFFLTAAGALGTTLLCSAFVHENFTRPEPRPRAERTSFWARAGEIARYPALVPLLAVIMLAQLIAQAPGPIVPLFVRQMLGPSAYVATFAGIAIAATGVAGLISSPLLGRRGDRLGYHSVLILSTIGAALFTFPQAWVTNIWAFLALRFGVGIFIGGMLPAANAIIGRSFPRAQRGQVYGITASATFMGSFLGPTLAGLVAARFGFSAVFIMLGVMTVTGTLCALATVRAERSAAPV